MTPKTVAIAAALAVLVLVSAAASALAAGSWVNGNELKKYCSSNSYERGICLGFTSAVANIVANEPVAGWRACIPDGVTRGQLRDIMVKFLDDHPEELHLEAASLAARAYKEAFPCPQ